MFITTGALFNMNDYSWCIYRVPCRGGLYLLTALQTQKFNLFMCIKYYETCFVSSSGLAGLHIESHHSKLPLGENESTM